MTFFRNIAYLLDSPLRYWLVAYLFILVAMAVTAAPLATGSTTRLGVAARRVQGSGWFLLAIGIALIAMRWPLFFAPIAFNPDESQVIAQAITLLEDPVVYRSIQSGSTGPFWSYFIMLPGLVGLDINFGTTRFIACLLVIATLAGLYGAVRLFSGEMAARLATWPALLCFGLPRSRDFIHYSSEYPALPILMGALFLMLYHYRHPERRPLLVLFLFGAALGALPFAKLQAAVIALPVAAFAGIYLLLAKGAGEPRVKIRRIAAFVAGGVTVPAFFFTMFAATGVLEYFWKVYIVNNFHYAERGDPIMKIVVDYLTTPLGYEPVPLHYKALFFAGLLFCVIRLTQWFRQPDRRSLPWFPIVFAGFTLAAALYAVASPGRHFPHYLHFVVPTLCLLCGLLMRDPPSPDAAGKKPSPDASASVSEGALLGSMLFVFPLAALLLQPLFFGPQYYKYPAVGVIREVYGIAPDHPVTFINAFKRPGDHLSVWGWHADYYVDTQLPMGTRSAVTEFHIRDVPLRDYYRRHYLAEFQKRRPVFFIDAVGKISHEFTDPALHGHQTFPELAEYVAHHYVEVAQPAAETRVRFFIRRDRAAEMHQLETVN